MTDVRHRSGKRKRQYLEYSTVPLTLEELETIYRFKSRSAKAVVGDEGNASEVILNSTSCKHRRDSLLVEGNRWVSCARVGCGREWSRESDGMGDLEKGGRGMRRQI